MEKNLLKIAIITILLICVCATIVNAYSFNATMTASNTTVAESKEFTVKVKVSNLDVGNNGINKLTGYFKYDTSVFETINDSSIDGLNSWTPRYTADNGKIELTKTTFVNSEEEVFQVTLKTKSGVSGKEGEINFTNIMASNSAQDIGAADISTKITIGTVVENVANVENVNVVPQFNLIYNYPVNNTTNNVVNNTSVTPYVNNTATTNTDIPYTGVEDTIVYIIGALIAVAVIFYIKIEKINNDMK